MIFLKDFFSYYVRKKKKIKRIEGKSNEVSQVWIGWSL